MYKYYLALILIILLPRQMVIVYGCGATIQDKIQPEEYAVYNSLLNIIYPQGASAKNRNRVLIINSVTQTHAVNGFDFQSRTNEVPDLAQDTINDLKSKSERSYIFEESFALLNKYKLLTKEDMTGLFPERDVYWETFHKRYPNSSGLISLSREGFNREMNQALVFFMSMCGGLCAD